MLAEEPAVEAALKKLNQELEKNQIIHQFREIEQRVAENQRLTELTAEIKAAQKAAVSFDYYEKPAAQKQALAEADRLTAEFDNHPLVVAYRERLLEANDLIQYLTKRIQQEMNEQLTDN
ncbi:cell fate (sporulation/competence/biofilm development) regulator YmcA (YheA/YmcA/DUF963 family) [Enterococcus sp. PF1-24]|uniref:YlbF family regulator n=1 Tax=unclassified Enterococcus TaxID=2608891 RepID=UPI002474BCB0|nr:MULTISPECIES: YlbF family regulator [unclassified Enterococcus]MDH6363777.1 cell fate (sporulation/competence/biofilm development) regulator YmcA (YheA/YmcA/DUF963 family) [Enterococcus sp. PFB1-1]MDH6400733.1 cell fate (sporulation/competence/biofilm development) regulator YmcA (YheA/YmcA/DUF963 family) [Enterococcus sp. PF1-24]